MDHHAGGGHWPCTSDDRTVAIIMASKQGRSKTVGFMSQL